MGVVIAFPADRKRSPDPGLAVEHEPSFLLNTARLIRRLAHEAHANQNLLDLHTAVDLRRPRIRRLLHDHPEALSVLDEVSDRTPSKLWTQIDVAHALAALLEEAAGGN